MFAESSFFDNVIIDNFEYNVESPENDKNETEALPMETYQEQAETTKPTSKCETNNTNVDKLKTTFYTRSC